jgi:hypothetical protein
MILPRRRFLLGAAVTVLATPSIVRAASLMPISVVPWRMPKLWGDGIHDDTAALQAIIDAGLPFPPGTYLTSNELVVRNKHGYTIANSTFIASPEWPPRRPAMPMFTIVDSSNCSLLGLALHCDPHPGPPSILAAWDKHEATPIAALRKRGQQ